MGLACLMLFYELIIDVYRNEATLLIILSEYSALCFNFVCSTLFT